MIMTQRSYILKTTGQILFNKKGEFKMKKYVIDENAKEKLIETKDYTREELKELIYGTVYDANVDALSEEDADERPFRQRQEAFLHPAPFLQHRSV